MRATLGPTFFCITPAQAKPNNSLAFLATVFWKMLPERYFSWKDARLSLKVEETHKRVRITRLRMRVDDENKYLKEEGEGGASTNYLEED